MLTTKHLHTLQGYQPAIRLIHKRVAYFTQHAPNPFPPTAPPPPTVTPTTPDKKKTPRLTRFDVPVKSERDASLPPPVPRSAYHRYALPTLMTMPELPTCSEIASRDFIHNALYNPQFGYFSKQVRIFQLDDPVPFPKLHSTLDFMNHVASRYAAFEDRSCRTPSSQGTTTSRATTSDASKLGPSNPALKVSDVDDVMRQIWHTPSELFKPWYGYAIARHLVKTQREQHGTQADLIIYEVGGGNGTLAATILDYLREKEPDLYRKTRYTLLEISAPLAAMQRATTRRHQSKIRIVHESVLPSFTKGNAPNSSHRTSSSQKKMSTARDRDATANTAFDGATCDVEREPCFVLAMEAIDNFAHDVVRYDLVTNAPYRGVVTTDEFNVYEEEYEPISDPLLARYLYLLSQLKNHAAGRPSLLSRMASWMGGATVHYPPCSNVSDRWRTVTDVFPPSSFARRWLVQHAPFAPNLSARHFVPTTLLHFFETLRARFPQHRLVLSDFSTLPDAIPGANGPVVQTRFQRTMVPVSTYMVQPGFFDIFFPTDFTLATALYDTVMAPDYSPERINERVQPPPLVLHSPTSSSIARPADPIRPWAVPNPTFLEGNATITHGNKVAPPCSPGATTDLGRLRSPQQRRTAVFSHRHFMEMYADLSATSTRSGENPLLMYYENCQFMVS